MYGIILRSSQTNPLTESTNLGLGNYDDDFFWQQIRSMRKGLYAWIAFGSFLSKRAIHETKMKLGRDGVNYYEEDTNDVIYAKPLDEADGGTYPRSKYVEGGDDCDHDECNGEDECLHVPSWEIARQRGEDIWQSLGDIRVPMTKEQWAAVAKKSGIDEEYRPIFWELVSGRHEASRSRDAELLGHTTRGVDEYREQTGADSGGIL